MKNMKKILSLLLSLVLILGLCLSVNVSAEDSTSTGYTVDSDTKTITVNTVNSSDYTKNTGIQDAINYINTQSDKTNWTITVSSGTYYRFTVLNGLDYLTVKAADGAEVEIIVLNDDNAPVSAGGGYPDTKGVSIRYANYVTIDGITFTSKNGTSCVYSYLAAPICNFNESEEKGDNIKVTNCTFNGSGTFYGVFFGDSTTWEISNCEFINQNYAISYYADNSDVNTVKIDSNTFTNCVRAVDGYFGSGYTVNEDTSSFGNYYFINNKIIGSEDLNCKILISDDCDGTDYNGTGNVTIYGNTLSNAAFLLFDLNLTNDVISDNTFGDNSYINVSSEITSTINLTVVCDSDESHKGYWELSSENLINIGGGDYSLSGEEIAIIKAAVEEANSTGSHTLTLDFSSLYSDDASSYWKVVTYLKYGVYWVGTPDYEQEPSVTKYVSGTDNESATTDDDGNYNLYAGDTVDFSLSILGPDYLYVYTGTRGLEGATERGTYEITVHDVMDDVLTLDESSIEINIEGAIVSNDYYTVTTDTDDGCEFHIVIDLVALYNAGLYVDSEEVITINYSAVVSSDAAIGTYENSTWLTYEYINKTEVSTVEINVVEVESESEEEPDDTPDTTVEPTDPGEEETVEEAEANEEEVETETSDNTVIYMYATLGLLAAGGYLAITKKNLLKR